MIRPAAAILATALAVTGTATAATAQAGGDTGGDTTTVSRVAQAPAEAARPAANRVELELRPVLGLTANSWGGLGELRYAHDFRAPLTVGVELAPFSVVSSGQGTGTEIQARLHAAYSITYLAVGLGVGGQLRRFGRNGVSLASTLRLGRLDGLSFTLEYAYAMAANKYTGRRTIGFSDVLGRLQVPLTDRLMLRVEGGLDLQSWIFTTIGLRHRVVGDGGAGSWFVSGGFGIAGIEDRGSCDNPAQICGRSALSFGPTISFGLEHRF
ncbi:MAG TPA: hypothetical protein VHM31_14700 [Polyangia bacterium]|nr:hypothetical protein [Polyangia bacterium]